jgi:uncharacterized DUF497 family protein
VWPSHIRKPCATWKRRSHFTQPDNRFDYGERRSSTIGLLDDTVVVIAHTETEDAIHVISMRKVTRHEREYYFANL